jgi:alanyl-tRNA synthetase
MVPFKPYFTGTLKPEALRVATCQKCLRTQDIEAVGRSARHHTFFEMLGNFSFGDYFKKEAIVWAWEFVTKVLVIPVDKLWISIYQDDEEAFDLWRQEVGISAARIVRLGKENNFWEIGTGPCGPCSELYVDLGENYGCGEKHCQVGCECDRFLEIWNLVFIQYYRDEENNYHPLQVKGIDTGMGLERVAQVKQGVDNSYGTDLFREIINFEQKLSGVKYGADSRGDRALKIIADHCRAITFALADGAVPSNEGRGYVLRRLLRRAGRFGRNLNLTGPFLDQVAEVVIKQMADTYPELAANKKQILRVINTEEERFSETLALGTDILNRIIEDVRRAKQTVITGEDAFRLYDTYGFPLELTIEIAAEENLTVDEEGFKLAMEKQRQRAREARSKTDYLPAKEALYKTVRERYGETNFVGYDQLVGQACVLAIIKDDRQVTEAPEEEEVEIILSLTPCHAEAGGQVADIALITAEDLVVEVLNVTRPVEGLYVHTGKIKSGKLKENLQVTVEVDAVRRQNVSRNHSATHILQGALKKLLGNHVQQAGSLVEPGRLRFDFTHYAAITPEQLRQIEETVNQVVWDNLPVEIFQTSLEDAQNMGATALFGEKYGEQVRVVKMGDFSLELCGGTHLKSTGEVSIFKITGESSIGAGLRRIEAVTGSGAWRYLKAQEELMAEAGRLLKVAPEEVLIRLANLVKEIKDLERENIKLKARLTHYETQALLEQVTDFNGVKILAAQTPAQDMDSLRAMVDLLREHLKPGVILLGSATSGRVNLVAAVTEDLTKQGLHAGKLVKEVAPIVGGGGGGRPEMAQAGGKDAARLQEALDKAYGVVKKQLLAKG